MHQKCKNFTPVFNVVQKVWVGVKKLHRLFFIKGIKKSLFHSIFVLSLAAYLLHIFTVHVHSCSFSSLSADINLAHRPFNMKMSAITSGHKCPVCEFPLRPADGRFSCLALTNTLISDTSFYI